MKTACFKIREHLLDYHFGELEGLEAQRVVLHLENCPDCRAVLNRLDGAFSAAVEWSPEPKPGEIDRLVERLTPYLQPEEEETRESSGWMFGVGLALAAGLALFMVYATWSPERAKFEATSIAETKHEQTLPVIEVERIAPTEHLRVVASKDWNGEVRRSTPKVTRVSMDSGFAVMAFEGGKGRKLIVETPDVEVEVVGTRFYVDARPGLPTTIGVVDGKVAVKAEKGRELLAAGTERAYGKNGKKEKVQLARSNPYHSDSFLLEKAAKPAERMIAKKEPAFEKRPSRSSKLLPRKEPPRKYENAGRFLAPHAPDEPPAKVEQAKEEPKVEAPPPPPPPNDFDAARLLNEAERLVKEKQYDAAIALLEQALDTEDAQLDPFRPMLRYERARILLKQGKREFARAEFGRLTQSNEKEVAHQAKMSLCELELADDPCTAAACLRSIDSRESSQLLARWRLEELDCAHHKN
jgi:predicted negative regulator of RcsB-dependent stress response